MSMTRAEQAKMRKLELENAEPRAQIERHMNIYRDQAWELVTLRTALRLVRDADNPLEKDEDE